MIKKLIQSFGYAVNGIVALIAGERNMRIHLLAAICVVAAGLYFDVTITEWCVISICIGMVMAAEALNTAIEWLTDLVKPEHHPLAGKIKDAAAGGVLLAAVAAAISGLFIFWKYFFPA